ncbi:unnamed protein product [Mycena citricolor]|uniref:Uncharacterized protein n=1 Tax=Mycena citricolor TaxID=2018698 RepID=A0AAD2HSN5_9AGAR|nr:unnamed protein product [Mycena citricolor]
MAEIFEEIPEDLSDDELLLKSSSALIVAREGDPSDPKLAVAHATAVHVQARGWSIMAVLMAEEKIPDFATFEPWLKEKCEYLEDLKKRSMVKEEETLEMEYVQELMMLIKWLNQELNLGPLTWIVQCSNY